jgi:hypothetical protein
MQMKVLESNKGAEWLSHIVHAFNAGDLSKYDDLCNVYAKQLNAQPALVANERRLREKITILSLLELVFRWGFGIVAEGLCSRHY